MGDKRKKKSLPEGFPPEEGSSPLSDGMESFEDLEAKELGGDEELNEFTGDGTESDIFERSDPFERPLPKGGKDKELDKPRDRELLDDEE